MTKERKSRNVPVARHETPAPVLRDDRSLWSEFEAMDRFLARLRGSLPSFFRSAWPAANGGELAVAELAPAVDVVDKEKEILVRAELPGMEEDDIDVQLSDQSLRISGEKREEHEEEEGDYYRSELRYGSFQRRLPIPYGVDREAVSAELRNGVLTVRLPKTKESQSQTRRVKVKRG